MQVHTHVGEWRSKVFIHQHAIKRGDDLIREGSETRAFVIHPPEEPNRIKAIPVPEHIKSLCSE